MPPPTVAKSTVLAPSRPPERTTVMVAVPAPSPTGYAATLNENTLSLSCTVNTEAPSVPTTAPTGLASSRFTVRAAFVTASSISGTSKVWIVSPAWKVSVPNTLL